MIIFENDFIDNQFIFKFITLKIILWKKKKMELQVKLPQKRLM